MKMTKDQIKQLWIDRGWVDLKSYFGKLAECYKHGTHHIPELEGDVINPKTFWEAADEQFGTDGVCNSMYAEKAYDIEIANRRNYQLAYTLGITGHLFIAMENIINRAKKTPQILEIGCGYMSFAENYKSSMPYGYVGFDVVPRHEKAYPILGEDGTFTDEQIEELKKAGDTPDIFFSFNVFQHLTKKQIKKYLAQMYEVLPDIGYVCLANAVSSNGQSYLYGQIIELFKISEFGVALYEAGFNVLAINQFTFSNALNPYCIFAEKRKQQP